MPAAQINPKVNLLPSDRFEYSKLGRFFQWALTTGRYVMVMTELIVIMAFLSRFWFDRKLTDLREARIKKGENINSFSQIQARFEQTQLLLSTIRKTISSSSQPTLRLTKIQNLTPSGIQYGSIKINSDSVDLIGYATSGKIFSTLLAKLQNEATFQSVNVKKLGLSKDKAPGLDFEIALINKNP